MSQPRSQRTRYRPHRGWGQGLPSPSASTSSLSGSARFTGQRINIDLKDADIEDVFRLFADISGLNIVALPRIRGARIPTLKLNDVPWDHAFNLVVRANGWDYHVEGNVVTIGASSDLKHLRE